MSLRQPGKIDLAQSVLAPWMPALQYKLEQRELENQQKQAHNQMLVNQTTELQLARMEHEYKLAVLAQEERMRLAEEARQLAAQEAAEARQRAQEAAAAMAAARRVTAALTPGRQVLARARASLERHRLTAIWSGRGGVLDGAYEALAALEAEGAQIEADQDYELALQWSQLVAQEAPQVTGAAVAGSTVYMVPRSAIAGLGALGAGNPLQDLFDSLFRKKKAKKTAQQQESTVQLATEARMQALQAGSQVQQQAHDQATRYLLWGGALAATLVGAAFVAEQVARPRARRR